MSTLIQHKLFWCFANGALRAQLSRYVCTLTVILQDVVVPVAKPVIEERTIHIPKPMVVEKVIEVPRVVHREVPVERIVEVPQTQIEYRYRDVPVPRKVARPVVPPLKTFKAVHEVETGKVPPQSSHPLFSSCCDAAPRPRAKTHELRYYSTPPASRAYTATPTERPSAMVQPPVIIEGEEPAADASTCCVLSPRKHKVQRKQLVLKTSKDGQGKYNVRVATFSPRKAGKQAVPAEPPRSYSVPPTPRVSDARFGIHSCAPYH